LWTELGGVERFSALEEPVFIKRGSDLTRNFGDVLSTVVRIRTGAGHPLKNLKVPSSPPRRQCMCGARCKLGYTLMVTALNGIAEVSFCGRASVVETLEVEV
jgi:hypothetical protein